MRLFINVTRLVGAIVTLLNDCIELVAGDQTYDKMLYDGHEWDIIEEDGKRLTLRRPGTRVGTFFGKVFTLPEDQVITIKHAGGKIVPIR